VRSPAKYYSCVKKLIGDLTFRARLIQSARVQLRCPNVVFISAESFHARPNKPYLEATELVMHGLFPWWVVNAAPDSLRDYEKLSVLIREALSMRRIFHKKK